MKNRQPPGMYMYIHKLYTVYMYVYVYMYMYTCIQYVCALTCTLSAGQR